MKRIEDYMKDITRVMKANGTYSKALDIQIRGLASAMRNLDLANSQIGTLEEVTVWEETRFGRKLAPHPAFRIAKESQEQITRQMKALGLTVGELSGGTEEDPLADLTKKLIKDRKGGGTVKPE